MSPLVLKTESKFAWPKNKRVANLLGPRPGRPYPGRPRPGRPRPGKPRPGRPG